MLFTNYRYIGLGCRASLPDLLRFPPFRHPRFRCDVIEPDEALTRPMCAPRVHERLLATYQPPAGQAFPVAT